MGTVMNLLLVFKSFICSIYFQSEDTVNLFILINWYYWLTSRKGKQKIREKWNICFFNLENKNIINLIKIGIYTTINNIDQKDLTTK
jgi:hypothetical protein